MNVPRLFRLLGRRWFARYSENAEHPNLRLGSVGETAAREHLSRAGLKFLTANFTSPHGEIDLIFRDRDCLVFVEVKSRSAGQWTRPATAVDARKRRRLSLTAEAYVRKLKDPRVKWRHDIVEVLSGDDGILEVRHLVHAFPHDTRRPRGWRW